MKIQIILAAIILSLTAPAQISETRIKRQLETSKPQEIQLDLRRGETVAFDLQFLSYGAVMDISGATCTLHATTNGMPAGTSFQVGGTAGSNGTASVRISVDEWLPYQLTSGTWTLECANPSSSRIMRASGVVKLSGLYYPSTNSPLPVSWSTNFWTAMAAKVSTTDLTYTSTVSKASSAFSWGNHDAAGYMYLASWLSWLGTNSYVKAETDAIALSALATNKTLMAWGDRNLQFPTSGVAVDWSVDDVVTINGTLSLPGSLTLGGVTKSEWPSASSGAPAVWTNMVWGSVGTNSTYLMSWDVTNGTFKIEEILL